MVSQKEASLDNEKYQLGISNRTFIRENVSQMNENIALETRKLTRRGVIHDCFTEDSVVHIKLNEHNKGIKIPHKSYFCEHILDYEEEEEDLFHGMSQEVNNSVQFCY